MEDQNERVRLYLKEILGDPPISIGQEDAVGDLIESHRRQREIVQGLITQRVAMIKDLNSRPVRFLRFLRII